MTLPTQMRLAGFIASVPQLTFTCNGVARFYARIGVEHARKETDGTFTSIEPTFHDLVLYRASAERAYARFRKGDSFVASGYVHEYEQSRDGSTVTREEFVARRIGHDTTLTRFSVDRKQPDQAIEQAPSRALADSPPRAVGL